MTTIRLLKGDCLQKLKELEDNSIDSVVTDPPYEIGFMGKGWDDSGIANNPQLWKEVLRVLKPGGHLLSFSHSRTYHRQAVAVEDAGFEIRDQIMWIYGSGFPKSHNIGKAIDAMEKTGKSNPKAMREVRMGDDYKPTGQKDYKKGRMFGNDIENDNTEQTINNEWEGWGTALKPAHEPIVMARKPFKGTVADNVLEWGVGGINVDGCRIGNELMTQTHRIDFSKGTKKGSKSFYEDSWHNGEYIQTEPQEGRFPANIIFECTCDTTHTKPAPKSGHWPKGKVKGFGEFGGGESSYEGVGPKEEGDMVIHTDPNCPCYILDQQSGFSKTNIKAGKVENKGSGIFLKEDGTQATGHKHKVYPNTIQDEGGASRFFYCPKASKKDRNEGCDDLDKKANKFMATKNGTGETSKGMERFSTEPKSNFHPTVKPTDLMAYLVRLVTPKGGVVLDPFMGSGSTGKAAVREGMNFIGIERETEYMEIAKTRIEHEQKKNKHTHFFDI